MNNPPQPNEVVEAVLTLCGLMLVLIFAIIGAIAVLVIRSVEEEDR